MPSAIVNVMASAARKAARGLIRDFGEAENLQVSPGGPSRLVAEAVRRAERILGEYLHRARPDFGFVMAKAGAAPAGASERSWIVAPVDGVTNFLHGIPHFAISIALRESGSLTAGVVYEPLRDELFWAEHGAGSYLNRRRLRVSSRRDLTEAVLATELPPRGHPNRAAALGPIEAALDRTAAIRRLGSLALDLAYVAAGRYDALWAFAPSPWQIAAGIVLVREAGGFATDGSGASRLHDDPTLVAANDRLHAAVLRLFSDGRRAAVGRADG